MEAVKDRIAEYARIDDQDGDGSGSGYGYGSGYGDGDGYGSGSGDGSGSGYGYGDGSGSGYGDGDGSGSGYGDGDGYGSGSGSGSGYGDGSGYGYGDGIAAFNSEVVYMIDNMPTIIRQIHGNIARGELLRDDLTLEPCYVVRQGNSLAHGKTLREAQGALMEKLFDDMPTDERIEMFMCEFKAGKVYPARIFFDWHNRLTGSCEMGRREFARRHDIDIEHDEMTVDEFIALTENDYGGNVIKALKDAWQNRK